MLTQLLANWTKLVIGVCALMVTVGFVTGNISSDDFKTIIGIALGIHATTSGLSGLVTKA